MLTSCTSVFYSCTIIVGFGFVMNWVLIKKITELIGYTDDAIRAKIARGIWLEGKHWRKAPDGRLMFNLEAIQKWIES